MKKFIFILFGVSMIFTIFVLVDMKMVEIVSQDCDLSVQDINKYYKQKGKYPDSLAFLNSNQNLDKCNYQVVDDGYVFVLSGSQLLLQDYSYDSKLKSWKWD